MFFVDQNQKLRLLTHWLQETAWTRTLVFTRTKHGADKVVRQSLLKAGIQADAFHGNKSQSRAAAHAARFKSDDRWCWWPPTSPPAGWTSTTSRT